jgi:hypothetical protein
MTASWPPTIPQAPKYNGFSMQDRPNKVVTQTAQGYQNQRRRFTGTVTDVQVQMPPMTSDEKEDFLDFYRSTLQSGTLEFDWYDFSQDPKVAATFKFGEGEPSVKAVTRNKWDVSFTLILRS